MLESTSSDLPHRKLIDLGVAPLHRVRFRVRISVRIRVRIKIRIGIGVRVKISIRFRVRAWVRQAPPPEPPQRKPNGSSYTTNVTSFCGSAVPEELECEKDIFNFSTRCFAFHKSGGLWAFGNKK